MEPPPVPFDRLYAHRDWVRRVARALVLEESRAEDLEQEVWLAALRSPPREARSLRAWLGTVLRHAAGRMRRTEERRTRREEAFPQARPPEEPGDLVAEAEAHERVVRAVLALEEPYRTTVLLRYFEDLPPGEVARRLAVPVETVRTRVRRALERVRARLDGEERGHRKAWCLLLLPLARRVPSGRAVPAVAGSAAAATLGGFLVATTAKAAAVAAVVALAVGGWALWNHRGAAAPGPEPAQGPAGTAAVNPVPASAPGAPPLPGTAADPLSPPAPTGASLAVEVVDLAGRPIAGAEVRLHPPRGQGRDAARSYPFAQADPPVEGETAARAFTNGAGRAALGVPAEGSWTVAVAAEGFCSTEHRGWFHVGPPTAVRVLMRKGTTLRGTVQDAAGRPLPGVVVVADGSRSLTGVRVSSNPADAEGGYRMTGLRPGLHRLLVHTPGRVVHTAATLRLPGVERYDIRIGGGVTVKGRVLDDGTGLPLPGAEVHVEVLQGGTVFAGAGNAVTDADGAFLVADLPPGDRGLRVTARHDGYRTEPSPERRQPPIGGRVSPGTVREWEVRLTAGEDPPLFRPPEEEKEPEGPPGSVAGIVVDPAGVPVEGSLVTLWLPTRPIGRALSARTDGEGGFRLEGVPPGKRSLYARFPGKERGASASVTLEPGQALEGVRISLTPPGALSGIVRRADGASLSGAMLWWMGGSFAGPVVDHPELAMTDDRLVPVGPDGSFRLEDLGAMTVFLVAAADGCSPGTAPLIDLGEGEERSGIEILLQPTLSLAGRVQDGEGRPVASARVGAWGVADREGRGSIACVTGEDGRFRVEGLPAGPLDVEAGADGFTVARATAAAGEKDLRLVLERVLTITGRVVAAEGGQGLAGVLVVASPEAREDGRPRPRGRWEAATDPGGRFTIEGLTDGTWQVTAGNGGHGASTEFFPESVSGVVPGAAEVSLTLRRGMAIRGRFVDGAGAPCAKPLRVRAWRRTAEGRLEQVGGEALAGEDGSFVLGGLEPGTYELWTRPGAAMGEEAPPPMLVKGCVAGGEALVVTVPVGVRIRGRITNLPGAIVRGKGGNLSVHGTGEDYWPAMSVWPDPDGTFETGLLDPRESYDLLARDFPGRMGGLRGVRPGREEVVLDLGEGLRITGRVVDQDGASVGAGVRVGAWAREAGADEPGARSSTVTEADGSFTLTGLGEFRFGLNAGGGKGPWIESFSGEEDPVPAGTAGIRLSVRRGEAIRGRLLDAAGKPAAGLLVEGMGGNQPEVYTAEDGTFTLVGFEPGEVRLRVGNQVLGPFPVPSTDLEVRLP